MAFEPPKTAFALAGPVAAPAVQRRRLVSSTLLLLVAIAGTVLLARWSGLRLADVTAAVATVPLWLVAAFVALTATQIALSAWKWRIVLRTARPNAHDRLSFRFLYNCTALAAFLSQFMTVYLSSIVVRAWALKRHAGLEARYAATTSLFEQVFDVIALTVMLAPALVVWSLGGTFEQWIAVTAASICAGAASLKFFRVALGSASLLRHLGPRIRSVAEMVEESAASGLLTTSCMLKLYALSIVRYLTMLVRVPMLILAFGLPIAAADSVPGFTIVQATQVAALTPGQLGIREWSWSGVLAIRGYDLQLATRFAIDLRVVGMIAMALAMLTCIGARRPR
ncbi:MAG: lysylphosphatidylglycerol synthase transmembrane domain-containing protein [Bacillota bacterium]